ncbi:hypothetical protein AZE42_00507 [Rhizopogon vesiculosus]|uniref:Uncharacterized protein n=1 Tax=Rhizopogon vesiculosus TaxID=180088 RepID=A0A1J8Q1J3_9AGAM|nr:hypothetical protein AZE42_00507 [Rhizopogon vesiculosus]
MGPIKLLSAVALALTAAAVSWDAAPFNLASVPLAVRTWLPQRADTAPNTAWSQFWTGSKSLEVLLVSSYGSKLTYLGNAVHVSAKYLCDDCRAGGFELSDYTPTSVQNGFITTGNIVTQQVMLENNEFYIGYNDHIQQGVGYYSTLNPISLYSNFTLGKYHLLGLLEYQATGRYPKAAHNLG